MCVKLGRNSFCQIMLLITVRARVMLKGLENVQLIFGSKAKLDVRSPAERCSIMHPALSL